MTSAEEGACTDDKCALFSDDARPFQNDAAWRYTEGSLHEKDEGNENKHKLSESDIENNSEDRKTVGFNKNYVQDQETSEITEDNVWDSLSNSPPVDTNLNAHKTVGGDAHIAKKVADGYEFPPLTRIDPGTVGQSVNVELEDGRFYTRITRAVRPPIFEIPNFLSDEECDQIIESAKNNGLNVSNLFGAEIQDELNSDIPLSEVTRVSEQTWLQRSHFGEEFWNRLLNRLARLTEFDIEVINRSEYVQVVSYAPGGHYHAHLDSTDRYDLPCCFQERCDGKTLTPQWADCCRICRYITVLYYLNNAEEGGETAFPLTDASDSTLVEKTVDLEKQDWHNLSYYCYNSSLVVKPVRGTAIMWYNHFIDEQTGYLGKADQRSQHGGCDLLKGRKWIANNWISSPSYEDRFKPSLY
ncbi:hypothetical protein DPMN_177369 [Dreissena polymorpha]|uniref:Fe2OG dioxygenase domain-containing protein n=1 Tax=Dreissena polymorpha TaxID=45954 RepID=A0A9D4E8N0_DREPO|nr:hypothetical protein DPMN_177369 [Dreissena polymorpha]